VSSLFRSTREAADTYRKKYHQLKLWQLKTVPPSLCVVCAVFRGWFCNLSKRVTAVWFKREAVAEQGWWNPLPSSNPLHSCCCHWASE